MKVRLGKAPKLNVGSCGLLLQSNTFKFINPLRFNEVNLLLEQFNISSPRKALKSRFVKLLYEQFKDIRFGNRDKLNAERFMYSHFKV